MPCQTEIAGFYRKLLALSLKKKQCRNIHLSNLSSQLSVAGLSENTWRRSSYRDPPGSNKSIVVCVFAQFTGYKRLGRFFRFAISLKSPAAGDSHASFSQWHSHMYYDKANNWRRLLLLWKGSGKQIKSLIRQR